MKSQVWIGKKRLKKPLIQGGMGIGVSLSGLAGAVAKEGGAGTISAAQIGFLQPEFEQNPVLANLKAMEEELQKARKIAPDGILGFNIMVAMNHYETYVRKAVETGADFIVSGAGLPLELPAMVSDTDIAIAPIVSGARAAALILKYWEKKYHRYPDFIVIEGPEAGGHLGFPMEELSENREQTLEEIFQDVQTVVKTFEEKYNVKIPVFVAGGVYTGYDVKKFTDMGAAGAQIATRFIATHECDASLAYKERYLNVKPEDIVLIKSTVGMPGRALRSPFVERLLRGEKEKITRCLVCLRPCDPKVAAFCITTALTEAAKGNWEDGLFFCGSNGYRMKEIVHVKDIIDEIMTEYQSGE